MLTRVLAFAGIKLMLVGMISLGVIPTPDRLHAQGPAFESRLIASVLQKEALSAAGVISVWNSQSNVGITTSADGEFLYLSAYGSACINVFRRDRETGAAALIQTIVDRKNLAGVTDLTFSTDEKFAIASAFTSKTAVLYRRDASSGKLERVSVATNQKDGVSGLDWAIRGVVSPDSRYVYVANCGKNQQRKFTNGSITSFRIRDNDQLEPLEVFQGEDQCFDNVRGLVMLSDGKTLLATSSAAKCLVVIDRSTETGKLSVRQVLRDEENGVHGLDGAMFIATSPDEKFVYTSSGRFQGDHAIGVYAFDAESRLQLVQELINGQEGLSDYEGGNQLRVSPDGRRVYAVGTISGTLVVLDRDLKSGKLTFVESLKPEKNWANSVAGLCVSPDSAFVYVTGGERFAKVTIFKSNSPAKTE
jgi:6-phosphogluconolactonase (cycloisomerase 2 family)